MSKVIDVTCPHCTGGIRLSVGAERRLEVEALGDPPQLVSAADVELDVEGLFDADDEEQAGEEDAGEGESEKA